MKRDPFDVVVQHDPGGHEQFGEIVRIDAVLFVLIELYAGVLQQIDRVLSEHIGVDVELEVKLPGTVTCSIWEDIRSVQTLERERERERERSSVLELVSIEQFGELTFRRLAVLIQKR